MEDINSNSNDGLVRLYSGVYIDITNLKPEQIKIEDIAHALAFKPRFNGNGQSWYSIAAHSISVSSLVQPIKKLGALLHDGSEAYLFDIPKPYKSKPEFIQLVELENRIQQLIYEKFLVNLDQRSEDNEELKMADKAELCREWDLTILDSYLMSNPMADKIHFLKLFIKYINYNIQNSLDKVMVINTYKASGVIEEIEFLIEKYNLND